METGGNSEEDKNGQRNPNRLWPAIINVINSYAAYYRRQDKQPNDPLAHRIGFWVRFGALSTLFGSILAGVAAYIFWLQLEEATRTTVDANRAWVVPHAATVKDAPKIGDSVGITVEFENIGREPGIDHRTHLFVDAIDTTDTNTSVDADGRRSALCDDLPVQSIAGVIYPGKGNNFTGASSGTYGVLWDDDLDKDRKRLRIRGCIAYTTFGKRRYSWFCNILIPAKEMDSEHHALMGVSCRGGAGAT